MKAVGRGAVLAASVLLGAASATPPEPPTQVGLVVVEAKSGGTAATAGLRAGDRLVSWTRAALPPANPTAASGVLAVPGDMDDLQTEEAPRGPIKIAFERDGVRLETTLPSALWLLEVRPDLDPADLERFSVARQQIAAREDASVAAGLAAWAQLAARWRESQPQQALWLQLLIGAEHASRRRVQEARTAFGEARWLAEREHAPVRQAQVSLALGEGLRAAGDLAGAQVALEDALAQWRALRPDGLQTAYALSRLGGLAPDRGRLDEAEQLHRAALSMRERAAPDGFLVAASHNNLATIAGRRGNYEVAEIELRQALAILARTSADTQHASALSNLAIVERHLGRLADAEHHARAAVELHAGLDPLGVDASRSLDTLGNVLLERGRLREAEASYARAVELKARRGSALDEAITVTNQAWLEERRGNRGTAAALYERALDLDARIGGGGTLRSVLARVGLARLSAPDPAQRQLEQARAIAEAQAPDGLELLWVLAALGELAHGRGRLNEAQDFFAASLAQAQRVAPGSLDVGRALVRLGGLAAERAEWATAEDHHRKALEIYARSYPGSQDEALARYELGRVLRARGQAQDALAMLTAAARALDTQLGGLGGSTEIRSRFRAVFADLHFETIDLLIELGRPAEALQVLEASRSRELLAALSEHDVAFPDLPPDLDRRRRAAEARSRRILRELPEAALSERGRRLEELASVRRELADLDPALNAASPRVAQLHRAAALGADEMRTLLEPGTLLLAYVSGATHSFVFALDTESITPAVYRLPVGRAQLAQQVAALRLRTEKPSVLRNWLGPARELSAAILTPVAARLTRARRLLILPDGPLHFVPFAALPLPGDVSTKLLVEQCSLHFAPSATVLSELVARRRTGRPTAVVALADPSVAKPAAQGADSRSTGAVSLDLRPLPGARREAASLRQLFPSAATLWLGPEATEERLKQLGRDVTHLHLACHGLLDARSPLDSSLALAPSAGTKGEDGLLQAWEIVEQVHLDAELVMLSACETALGESLQGEGVLGLAQAFQLAGARAVVSTQWAIGDTASAALVTRFYAGLRAQLDAAEALRQAQLAALHRPDTAHPFHWASFRLDGDWR